MEEKEKRNTKQRRMYAMISKVVLVVSALVLIGVIIFAVSTISKVAESKGNDGVVYLPKETEGAQFQTGTQEVVVPTGETQQIVSQETSAEQTQTIQQSETDTQNQTTQAIETQEATQTVETTQAETTQAVTTQAETTQVETTQAPETTQAATTQAATQAAGTIPGKPMSRYEVHQGKWDLASLDNTVRGFGYAEENRAENMVPTDWSYYENKWGMYNVDWIQDINSKTIYLTMDVGFPNDYTEGIIETLREKNVRVVFFITKMFLDGSPDTVQWMIDEGHIIGNHTCTHPEMPSLGIEQETKEIMDLSNAMYDKFGYEMKLFRFPEGRFSDQSLALVENLGMKTVFWSYAYNDYSAVQPEVGPSYEKAVRYLHPGAIYLLHASSSTNAAFLGDFIDAARAAGYEFGIYPLGAN